ncbi:MAG: YfiR family protein [Gammaproteobacteria bacterium]|nr:YfiR family protein [Gammaproteobacteria bacterium]
MNRPGVTRCFAMLILLSSIVTQQSYAADDSSSKLKAVYLVNFARYVNWERIDAVNINLCVHKNTSIYDHLDKINNVDIGHGRKLIVLVDPEEISLCEIVYWDEQTVHLRNAIAMEGILEVTDSQDAFDNGMDVLFFLDNNKLRFFIADITFNTNELQISSKLMRLSSPPSDFSGGGIMTDFFIEYAIVFNYLQKIRVAMTTRFG